MPHLRHPARTAYSYTYPEHELLLRDIAHEIGFAHISLSSQLQAMVKIVPRGMSATADAYLTPHIRTYLDNIAKGSFIMFPVSQTGLD